MIQNYRKNRNNPYSYTDEFIKECVYLNNSGLKKANEVLHDIFIFDIANMCHKFFSKKNYDITKDDIIAIGYTKYWEIVNKLINKPKDFKLLMSIYIINYVRNEYRKHNWKKMHRRTFNGEYEKVLNSNILYTDTEFNKNFWFDVLEDEIKKYKSKVFKDIYFLKKDGYSYDEIAKKLKTTSVQVNYFWNYHKKIIKKIILEKYNDIEEFI